VSRYSVEFSARAYRQFARLNPVIRKRLGPAIDSLADDPRRAGVAALSGTDDRYRFRVGAYRVVFAIEDDRLVILVLTVGHRRDVYLEQ